MVQRGDAKLVEASVVALPTSESLTRFVREFLCSHDRLDPGQTPLYQTPVKRSGRTCAVVYHVEGPRMLRTSALWASDEHRIMFYDSTGTKFSEVKLSEEPEIESLKV